MDFDTGGDRLAESKVWDVARYLSQGPAKARQVVGRGNQRLHVSQTLKMELDVRSRACEIRVAQSPKHIHGKQR